MKNTTTKTLHGQERIKPLKSSIQMHIFIPSHNYNGYAASNAKKLVKNRNSQKRMNRSAGGVMMLTGSILAAKT